MTEFFQCNLHERANEFEKVKSDVEEACFGSHCNLNQLHPLHHLLLPQKLLKNQSAERFLDRPEAWRSCEQTN